MARVNPVAVASPMSGHRLNRIIGVSWAANPDPDIFSRVQALTSDWSRWESKHALLASENADRLSVSGAAAVSSSTRELIDLSGCCAVSLPRVLERLSLGLETHPADCLSPVALVWGAAEQAGLYAYTDRYGVGQLFYGHGRGASVVSNSAALVAHVLGAQPDKSGLLAYALFGAYLRADTAFQGVAKLIGGHEARLEDGRVEIRVRQQSSLHQRESASVEALASNLVQAMTALSEIYPEADFELSGGVDSRLMLAALPTEYQKRHRYITIGSPDSRDVLVSREIAKTMGLDHHVVDVSGMSLWGAGELKERLNSAVDIYDYGGNPVDKVTLLEANRIFPSAARFSGQNGEIVRGFYHPGQDLDAEPSEQLAMQLANWRLIANDRVSPLLLSQTARDLEGRVRESAGARLLEFGGRWGDVIDRFYLYERMQRWVGNSAGILAGDRQVLFPFFNAKFVDVSLALPAAQRSESKAAYDLMRRLSPSLADIELANGVRPGRASAPGWLQRGTTMFHRFRTAVERRVLGRRKASLGSSTLIDLWVKHELYRELPAADLHDLGIFDSVQLERLLRGEWRPDRPTLGFVLICARLTTI